MTAAETLKRGLKFTAVGQFFAYAIRFGSNLALTRLLAPDYFGVMAVAMLFVYAASMLCDVGLRSAIISEKRADEQRFRDVVWSVMTLRIVALAILTAGFSLGIKFFIGTGWLSADSTYADPRLGTAMALLVIASSIGYLESVEVVYRERLMDFRTILKLDLVRQVINTSVTVTWAWFAPSIVALVAGSIIANTCITFASYVWLAKRKPAFIWSLEDIKFLWERGKWLWVSAILTFAMNVTDRLFMARHFEPKLIGLHSIALLYSSIITDLVSRFIYSVAFPLVSQSHRDGEKEIWKTYYKSLSIVVKVALPSGFFFMTFGDKLIELLYDQRYHDAGPLLRAFGYLAFLSIYLPAGEIYVALGQAKKKSAIYVLRLITLMAGLFAWVPALGLMGGIYALLASQCVGAVASQYFNHKLGLFKLRRELEFLAMMGLLILVSHGIRAAMF